jgi:hypothetical protein
LDRTKVGGKVGQLGDKVHITAEKSKITINSKIAISKRYFKVWISLFLSSPLFST